METLSATILAKLLSKKRGTYTRIGIRSKVKGTAKATADNAAITKFTQTTVRIGVNYSHIKGVVPKGRLNSWYHWEIPNLVAVHNETAAKYINFATTAHSNSKVGWLLNGNVTTTDELIELGYLTPAMAKKSSSPVITVALDNIYMVK